jgi:hypothetical protein
MFNKLQNLKKSSTVVEMYYDDAAGQDPSVGTLRVRETNGATYDFKDVPQHVVQTVLAAPDLGLAYSSHIRNGGYKWNRVGFDD